MNYSLGNMLGGSNGSLNPDKLSLNLQFAADKTLTARKGPTPTFTRASTATFVGSDGLIQSAAINAARFEHDPVTLASRGLLIEESRTNLVVQSENFGTTWQTNQTSLTLNNIAAPDGLITADRLNEDISVANHQIVQSLGSLTAAQPYTFSVFAKAATHTTFQMTVSTAAFGSGIFANFILTGSGSIGNSSGATARIEGYLDGWYRCSISINSVTGGTGGFVQIASNNNNSASARLPSYLGTNAQIVNLWGAQLEQGSFPTSYIPTTTASVVRSADVCSISGSNFTGFWNQSAGTLVEAFEASPNTNTTYVSASNGNIVQNSVHLDNDTGLMRAVYYSGSSLVATLDLGSVGTVGTVNTIATAYSVNDFAASRNGGTVVTDTSGAVPASLSQMNIGTDERSQTPTSFYSNRCIKSLRYYKKRLANAKLQTLST